MNVYEKLQQARVTLQAQNLKKSGKNAFSGFTYFELADFLPTVNNIFDELKLCSNFSIEDNIASLTIINSEKADESTTFKMPTAELQLKGCTAIQALGGVNTYCKRYLYLNALEIVEADMLDIQAGKLEENKNTDIFEGLKACASIAELKHFYKEQYKNVTDKKGFEKLKDELKEELNLKTCDDDYERLVVERQIEAHQNMGTLNRL